MYQSVSESKIMADYYEILGVSKDAGKDEIKAAFRKKIFKESYMQAKNDLTHKRKRGCKNAAKPKQKLNF